MATTVATQPHTTWAKTTPQVIIPDAILPVQFYAMIGQAVRTGARALAFAVLEEAVTCVVGLAASAPTRLARYRLAQEAHDWFMRDDPGGDLYTFVNICLLLGYDPAGVRAYADRQFRKLPPVTRKPFTSTPQPSAIVHVRLNKSLQKAGLPPWLPQVQIRFSGRTMRFVTVGMHERTRMEATQRCEAYIASEQWRQYLSTPATPAKESTHETPPAPVSAPIFDFTHHTSLAEAAMG